MKYCGLKRLSLSVEAALTMEAEIATAIASDSIEMHLKIKKCIKEETYFRFSRRFRFVKWYFAQCLLCCFGCYFAVAKLWVVVVKRIYYRRLFVGYIPIKVFIPKEKHNVIFVL